MAGDNAQLSNTDEILSNMSRDIINSMSAGPKLGSLNDEEARAVLNAAYESIGNGSYDTAFQMFFTEIDRFRHTVMPQNNEHSGMFFMTRPKLNLSNNVLRECRTLVPLMTVNPTSMAFAIRCLLDTKFSRMPNNPNDFANINKALFFNRRNPFMVPLCNALIDFNGMPDPFVETYTTEPGFQSEDQTIVIGGDNLNRTYDLSLTFRDLQYGPIATIIFTWLEWMRLATSGIITPYMEDINDRRLSYTVSIYRFTMDPTRRYITMPARAVGCFPKTIPLGSMSSINEGELFVDSIGRFTIPFTANKVIYRDYAIYEDFNRLVRKYNPDITPDMWNLLKIDKIRNEISLGVSPENNFRGIPYIIHTGRGVEMHFFDIESLMAVSSRMADMHSAIDSTNKGISSTFNNVFNKLAAVHISGKKDAQGRQIIEYLRNK